MRRIEIGSVDHAPEDLYAQVPFTATLLRQLPGDDRPDYWLASVEPPLRWQDATVTHVVLVASLAGTNLDARVRDLPVGIAFVTDSSLLDEPRLSFSKCTYVAIGTAHELTALRGALVLVFGYLLLGAAILPFTLPALPRTIYGVIAAFLVLPAVYLLGEWLVDRADRIRERPTARRLLKVAGVTVVWLLMIVICGWCSAMP